MVVWPWIVSYSSVDFGVGVSGAFGTELPYRPIDAMFVVQEFDEGVCGVAVSSLGVGGGGTGGSNDWR